MYIRALSQIDFYKADHRRQYPEGTELVVSNFTPRSNKLATKLGKLWDERIVFAGLQGFCLWFLQDVFDETFFELPREVAVGQYKRRMDTSLGPNAVPVEHLNALHNLGYLPIEIRALPEGTSVRPGIPVLTIHNTLPEFFWLPNYLETVLSNSLWKTCTTATIARQLYRVLEHFTELTGASKEGIGIQGHDFSARGQSGPYDAAMSGFGHLLYFIGTDTVAAIDYAEDYYDADADVEPVGVSVPATEHSVTCASIADAEESLKKYGVWRGITLEELT